MASRDLLLVGATGFIGRALLPALVGKYAVTAVRFASPAPDPTATWIRLPTDPTGIADRVLTRRPAVIVNAAALASPAACEADPGLARRLNVELPAALAESDDRLIHLSTDQVFDGSRGNYAETDDPKPTAVYGESKLAGEREVLGRSGNSVVLRVNLVCGRSAGRRPSSVDSMIAAATAEEEIRLFADEYRSPVAISDVVRAVLVLIASEYRGILHLGGPRLSRLELGRPILAKHGLADRVRSVSILDFDGPPRAPDTSFDSSRAKRVLGFTPKGLTGILEDC